MPAEYSFVSVWTIAASREWVWGELERMLQVVDAADDAGAGPRPEWWRGVAVVGSRGPLAPGKRVVLTVRSPLGYRLRMDLVVSRVEKGCAAEAVSCGDLRGSGSVEVAERAPGLSSVTIRWNVRTERVWMNATAWALRPVFVRAHSRVMRAGERGLAGALSRAGG